MFGFSFGKKESVPLTPQELLEGRDGERRLATVYALANAAACLYGVVSKRDFVDKVICKWHPEYAAAAESVELWDRLSVKAREESGCFVVHEDELVHAAIGEDWARQSAARKHHLGKTPWLPEKEAEFVLAGTDEGAAAKTLRGLCGKGIPGIADADMTQGLINQCVRAFGDDGELEMAAKFLPMMTGKDADKVERALSDLRNKTRAWALFGHTAEELGMQREIHGKDDPSLASSALGDGPQVGRNDPCPCGSGKKYKKCCGR